MSRRNDTRAGEYFKTLEEMLDYIPIDKNYLEREQILKLIETKFNVRLVYNSREKFYKINSSKIYIETFIGINVTAGGHRITEFEGNEYTRLLFCLEQLFEICNPFNSYGEKEISVTSENLSSLKLLYKKLKNEPYGQALTKIRNFIDETVKISNEIIPIEKECSKSKAIKIINNNFPWLQENCDYKKNMIIFDEKNFCLTLRLPNHRHCDFCLTLKLSNHRHCASCFYEYVHHDAYKYEEVYRIVYIIKKFSQLLDCINDEPSKIDELIKKNYDETENLKFELSKKTKMLEITDNTLKALLVSEQKKRNFTYSIKKSEYTNLITINLKEAVFSFELNVFNGLPDLSAIINAVRAVTQIAPEK